MYRYQITLRPLGAYFFGREMSFGRRLPDGIDHTDKAAREYFEPRQSYFARSDDLPQQTQMLGLLREQVLLHNGGLKYGKNNRYIERDSSAVEKIGQTGWQADPKQKQDLGAIKQISPLYLWHTEYEEAYIRAPLDYDLDFTPESSPRGDRSKSKGYINDQPRQPYRFAKRCDPDHFLSAKDHLYNGFVSAHHPAIPSGEIFEETLRTHVQTLGGNPGDEDQYFKVAYKRITDKHPFVFGFDVLAKEALFEKPFREVIRFGGEGGLFEMTVRLLHKPTPLPALPIHRHERIVLISDAKVHGDVFESCRASLATKTPMRSIEYHKNDRRFAKSSKHVLLSAGSVLYPLPGEAGTIIDLLERKQFHWHTIGHNHYQHLNPNPTQGDLS